jgi:hypothetical protein
MRERDSEGGETGGVDRRGKRQEKRREREGEGERGNGLFDTFLFFSSEDAGKIPKSPEIASGIGSFEREREREGGREREREREMNLCC